MFYRKWLSLALALKLRLSPPFRISRHKGFPFLSQHIALEVIAMPTRRDGSFSAF